MRLGVLLLVIICLFQSIYCKLNEYEQVYVKLPNRTIAREHLKEYTSYPHIAGSTGDYKSAIYTLQQLQGFGLNASLVEHDMYANYPLHRVLRLVNATDGQIIFSANMTEPAVEVDPTSNDTTVVPTFNGYSASGNTTAPLVFANYGQIDDFEYLQKAGINITGCVVIVKYGRIFRGVKAMLAQKFGASGLLIYSDPYDDGFVRAGGDNNTYPLGPWRPEYGVQRGSVQYLPICPGSPSQERMKICREEDEWNDDFVGSLIPSIPVQPISWGDALPLMRSLVGTTVAPADWQKGGFSSLFNYSLGPSSLTFVQLTLVMNYTTVPIWNVVATLSGKRSDQIVLVGNHRDAWVFGATDPNSGTSVMLEMARSLMALKNTTGWVPERDIVICSWDAEEYGLIGSTAWGEMNAEYLQKSVIAYVNTDIGVSGSTYLDIGGTPSLRSLIRSVTDDLPFPGNPNISLSEFFNVSQLGILGSGSDYTVFLDHLGIPSLDMGYLNPFEGGVYHSIYDSFYWMDTFGDPGFIFHEGMAQLMGLVVIRLSDSIAHPFNFTNYAYQLSEYLEGLKPKAPEGTYFGVLETAIEYFTEAAVNIDAQKDCVLNSNCGNLLIDVEALNTRLRLSERRMLLNAISNPSDGLPYRPWYKHAIQAPGIYYGYGSQTFPGIMQGILDNDTTLIQEQVFKAAIAITDSGSALTKLSLNGTSTPALCYGTPYGSMSLVAYGGFSPVYYSIDGKEWSLSNNIYYNLSAGMYSGFARDSEGFIASIFVNVPEPKKLEISVTIHKSVATANVTNGVGNYTITWSTGESENSIVLPKHGNYSVSVFSHGCSASTDFFYSADKKKKMSAGGVAGIVISVLIIIAVIVAVIFYLRKRNNKTVHYQNL